MSSSDRQLLNWRNLPHWLQDNHYILSHYRPASYSFTRSFLSLFYLHNEFVNIHTHLFGTLLFISLSIYDWSPPLMKSWIVNDSTPFSGKDTIAFALFYGSAITCLLISAIFHAIANHSPRVAKLGNQLDYVGIVALITGSVIPSIYYGFYCDPDIQKIYWAMISILGIGCVIISVSPKFRSPNWRPIRTGIFIALGLSAVFPVLHGLKLHGIRNMESQIGLSWLVLQGVLYIIGAGLYAVGLVQRTLAGEDLDEYQRLTIAFKARVPERWSPGRFDVWGSSHQIFHVLIVLAALAHLQGLMKASHHAHTAARCDSSFPYS